MMKGLNTHRLALMGLVLIGAGVLMIACSSPAVMETRAAPTDQTEMSSPPTAESARTGCGGQSGGVPPLPEAPPADCVLIIEWQIPPQNTTCGILLTHDAPSIPADAEGKWWLVETGKSDSRLQEYLDKNPYCQVEDLR